MGATRTASEIDSTEGKFLPTRTRILSSITASTSVVLGALSLVGLHRVTGPRIILLYVFGQPLAPAEPSNPIDAALCSPARPGSPSPRQPVPGAGTTVFE